MASKFFEHFVAIADAMNTLGGTGLWCEQDGFYYDQLRLGSDVVPLRIRSMVGLLPLLACEILEHEALDRLPGFKRRMQWFLDNRPDLAKRIAYAEEGHGHRLLAIPSRERLERVLRFMLDENEFLSPYGIRSVSRVHGEHPYRVQRRRRRVRRRLRARRIRPAGCSAATPTGAVRSGSRSTTCSSRRWSATTTSTAMR